MECIHLVEMRIALVTVLRCVVINLKKMIEYWIFGWISMRNVGAYKWGRRI